MLDKNLIEKKLPILISNILLIWIFSMIFTLPAFPVTENQSEVPDPEQNSFDKSSNLENQLPDLISSGQIQDQEYFYQAEGRRDPFVPLIGEISKKEKEKLSGIAGITIGEIKLVGCIKVMDGGMRAMVQGPEGKAFLLKENDQLYDGLVKMISIDKVVFQQKVKDPFNPDKTREILVKLNEGEEK